VNYLLSIEDLSIDVSTGKSTYNIVKNIQLNISKKQKYGIVGESGSGKSVTSLSILKLLDDILEISEGQILFNGKDMVDMNRKDMQKIRGNEISVIFQEPMTALDPMFTIEHQIQEVLRIHNKYDKKERKRRIISILKEVGFSNPNSLLKKYPHELSGGMRQRIMIAMAMICEPKLLIADEPTTALDVTIQAQILHLMEGLTEDYDTSILLITHDLGVIAEICERVAVMYAGTIVEDASVQTLFDNPQHPYTKGLINSVDSLSDRSKPLYSIPGNVPPIHDISPNSCRFASRCPFAMDKCFKQDPPEYLISDNHFSKCWLHEQEGYNENEKQSSSQS